MLDIPIYVEFLGKNKYSIHTEGKEFFLEKYVDGQIEKTLVSDFTFADTIRIGEKLSHPYLNFELALNPNFIINEEELLDKSYKFEFKNIDDLTQEYIEKLNILPINKDATILKLTMNTSVVEKDISFLKALGNEYLENELTEKNEVAYRTVNFIDNLLLSVEDSLKFAESKLESFREKENFMDLSFTAQQSVEKLQDLETEQAKIKTNIKYYKYLLEYLEENSDINSIIAPSSIGIDDVLLNELILQLQNLSAEKVALSYAVNEKNIELNRINLQIQTVRNSLVENVKSIISSSEIQLGEINSRVAEIEVILNKLPSNERNLVKIQREFTLNDNLYTYLLQKRAEAGIVEASNVPQNKILDKARLVGVDPIWPKPIVLYLLAVVLGLLLPTFYILTADYMDNKVKEEKQITRRTSIPVIAKVWEYNKNNYSAEKLISNEIIESFRAARLNLAFTLANTEDKIIGFTSTVSGEGKSFCASNLATAIALTGKKVVLLEVDLRRPTLSNYFNVENKNEGLTSYLVKKSDILDIIQPTNIEDLDIIVSGVPAPNPTELIGTRLFDDLMYFLKNKYDYVIVDAPPIGIVPDYYALNKYVSTTIFVTRYNYSQLSFIDDIQTVNEKGMLKNLSIIFNGMPKSQSYGAYSKYNAYYLNGENKNILKKIKEKIT